MEYYKKSADSIIELLGSSKKGLTKKESELRLSKYGPNELSRDKKNKILSLITDQLKDFLIILLLVAGVLSFIVGDKLEGFAILIMIILTVLLGFFQEYKAEKSLEKLKKITSRKAVVLRNGEETKIDSAELVPGDIVIIETGSIVPADIRLILSSSLKVDESALTGESNPEFKHTNNINKEVHISEQKNMVFMGTTIVYGNAKGIVVKTGMKTEFGKIARSLSSVTDMKTPMKRKLTKLGKQILIAVITICFIIFISSFLKGTLSLNQAFMVALSLAVAAAPTSLPAVVTISLSRGVVDLAKKNMLVKKLPAAEGLGSTTFICTDKTGTLTKNEMTIKKFFVNNKLFQVSGSGYSSEGKITQNNKSIKINEIQKLIDIGLLCNSSELITKKDKFEIIGDPTEVSLLVLGNKLKHSKEDALKTYDVIQELPFDSDRKMMSVVCKNNNSKKIESLTKGGSLIVLDKCNKILINNKVKKLTPLMKNNIKKQIHLMESSALRVLSLSYKILTKKKNYSMKQVENDMIFIGIVGMLDPPRMSIKNSIKLCNDAGIDVMMITGDSPITAKAIAKEIGLLRNKSDIIITGTELDKMNDEELSEKITRIRICARFMPIQKLRIVDALQNKGEIVSMTGDGVNDAPALKKADIGVAMGITGTDVAKEVSEMTLADDNFSTIVSAVEEGRNIYDKMLKSVKYLLTCNTGEILTVFFALLVNLPIPLLPLQILLMNLLTDGLPALALSVDKSNKDVMNRPPRDPKENPVTGPMLWLILLFGIFMAIGSLFLFNLFLTSPDKLPLARTISFTTLVMFEMFAVISSRTLYHPAINKDFFKNKILFLAILSSIIIQILIIYIPFFQKVFGTTTLSLTHWLYILGVSFIGFVIMEFSKFFIKYKTFKVNDKK